ncbi:MAG: hypothetical protein EZS28_015499 [Streblomastix strix]|uniref:Reverse transcriptase domain-containing protein n=1 Tax=Streblomastix strix TaxID=222440 RepID=A0A5J4W3A0_9EUKA|nr:MAG: hypothetical protein EZS28_015499 [Streblomastix strix]
MQKHNAVLRVMKIEDNDQVFKEQKVVLNLQDILESSKQKEMIPNRLLNRIDKLQQINADYWIEMGAQPAWTSKYIGESKFQEELDQELKLGVVRQAKDEEILHWNTSYTVPKAGGKRRRILDCKELNAATKPAHFQMENINTVMQLIQRGDYSTHLDMEKAYHHVRVSQELQKYFGFHFRGEVCTYMGLPFGWNRSPMLEQGSTTDRHVGDNEVHGIAGLENTKTEVQAKCIKDIRVSGMEMVNNEPYNPINSSKTQAVETQVEQMDRNCQERRKSEDQGSGICYRRAELRKDVAGRCIIAHEDIVQKTNISSVEEHLERQMQDGQKITRRFDMVVGENQGELANVLREESTKLSINHGCIGNELGCCLGTSNNGGGSNLQDRGMGKIMDTQILQPARDDSDPDGVKEPERFHSDGQLHPRFKNVIADSFSRIAANGDYYVKQKVLDKALAILGLPVQQDIFASRTNKRLRSYCNSLLDHQAYAVNGYSFSWSQINPYLHPPISEILKVLRKVREDNAEAVLVIPSWKGQVWSRWIEEMKIAEVDLGEGNECLEMGKLMKDLHQQLPPGRMKAVRLTNMRQENFYSGKWAYALDLKMML